MIQPKQNKQLRHVLSIRTHKSFDNMLCFLLSHKYETYKKPDLFQNSYRKEKKSMNLML